MSAVTEDELERAALDWFAELGYEVHQNDPYAPGEPGEERESFDQPFLLGRLRAVLNALNPDAATEAVEEAIRQVQRHDQPSLALNNQAFHRLLTDGVEVEVSKGGKTRGVRVRLFDFEDIERNDFLVVSQFSMVDPATGTGHTRRPDIVVFVNGLPLGVVELKNPADPQADVWDAYQQLQTYKHDIPNLFVYNVALVGSDDVEARIGSLTAPKSRFGYWRTIEGDKEAPASAQPLEVLIKGVFDKERFVDLARHFVVYEQGSGGLIKKLAGYHQFHAVRVAVDATRKATAKDGDRKIGVVWHTQGSGKSLSMLFYAGKLVVDEALGNPTLVVLTDRNDLDDQLFQTFSHGESLLRQKPQQAKGRVHLQELLQTTSGGVYFTTIQKFLPEKGEEQLDAVSERRNIIVIADEAHRSQYGFKGRLDRKTGQIVYGYAKHLRDALPAASFIGFTGTPVELEDKDTRKVFGNEISVYDIQQAVEDGATVPIFYEARLPKLNLDEAYKPKIDPDFQEVTEKQEADTEEKEALKTEWTALEKIVGNPERVAVVAEDLVAHFEKRQDALEGKALIVCMSRRICADLYAAVRKLRPHWHDDDDDDGVMKVVMTGSASDPEPLQLHVRSKKRREGIAKRFKDPADPLKMVFVRDMWLTGFDAPCLHTLYVDKPMRGHNLMQAIARVNRVFGDKPGGLVVDYLGILGFLKQAMSTYTQSGGKGDPAAMQDKAVEILDEKLELLRELFHDFDYSGFFTGSPKDRLALLPAAREHVLSLREEDDDSPDAPTPKDKEKDGYERFMTTVTELSKAFSLAMPHDRCEEVRNEVAFFQAVKAGLSKLETGSKKVSQEALDRAIKTIVSNAVISEGVVDIFAAAGIERPDISILSDEFLKDVASMKHKRLAVELLHRLLNGEVRDRLSGSVVQQRSFAEMLEKAMVKYRNRSIDSAAMIQELIELAKRIQKSAQQGEELGLSQEEYYFYEALAQNESAKEVMGEEHLAQIAHELLDKVRNEATVDWTLRKNVQAKMRTLVKRTLRRHGYPPDAQKQAVEIVLEQARRLGLRFASTPPPPPEQPMQWTKDLGTAGIPKEFPYPIAVFDDLVAGQASVIMQVKTRWDGVEKAVTFLVACELGRLRELRGSLEDGDVQKVLADHDRPLALGSWLQLARRLAALLPEDDDHPVSRAARSLITQTGKPSQLAKEIESQITPFRNLFAHAVVSEQDVAAKEKPFRQVWEQLKQGLSPLQDVELLSLQSIDNIVTDGFEYSIRRHMGPKQIFPIMKRTLSTPLQKEWCYIVDEDGHSTSLEPMCLRRHSKKYNRDEVYLGRGVWLEGKTDMLTVAGDEKHRKKL